MHYYEYGKENDKTIVFLHGANFVHSFGRQYPLAEKISSYYSAYHGLRRCRR